MAIGKKKKMFPWQSHFTMNLYFYLFVYLQAVENLNVINIPFNMLFSVAGRQAAAATAPQPPIDLYQLDRKKNEIRKRHYITIVTYQNEM